MTGPSLAVFVTPHGFGHAARASAVMEALAARTDARFELYASSPRWFFDESVAGLYRLHELETDVGFVQRSALAYDAPATARALRAMVPFDEGLVEGLALELRLKECRAVLCDIAPLGIAVAERAGIPSVLVENFTWPWLYEPLLDAVPELRAPAEELARWTRRATVHVQTEPLCAPDPRATLRVPPIGRPARRTRADVRAELGLAPEERVVVVTMGGVPEAMPFLERLRSLPGVTFLVTGAAETRRDGNLRLFDNATRIYMPEFVRAADAVVTKLGYSTLAEVWAEGRPVAWVTRADFRETGPLVAWASCQLSGFEIPGRSFEGGEWIDRVPELLALPGTPARAEGGAGRVADFVAREVLGFEP